MRPIERLLGYALDIGERMLISGAEVHRVEDTISRIMKAYGCLRVDAYTITNLIVASCEVENEAPATLARRITKYSTNLEKVDKLNDLSRRICREKPDLDEIEKELDRIEHGLRYTYWQRLFIFVLVSFSFSVFFGGSVLDSFISAAIAIVLFFGSDLLERMRTHAIVQSVLLSALGGALAIVSVRAIGQGNIDMIIIGNIMLLIPGVQLTNSIRDMLGGDLMAGLLRLADALVIAISVALGFAIVLLPLAGMI